MVGYLPPTRQVSCFISGIKEGIEDDFLAGWPTDPATAIGPARLYEAINLSQRRQLRLPSTPVQKTSYLLDNKLTTNGSLFQLKCKTDSKIKSKYNCTTLIPRYNCYYPLPTIYATDNPIYGFLHVTLWLPGRGAKVWPLWLCMVSKCQPR